MIIRLASEEDIPGMIELGATMHAESIYRQFDYDREKLFDSCRKWISHPDLYFMAVAEDNDAQVIGMFIGFISEYYFGRDLCAYDLLFFVHPFKRGGLAAVRLIKAFEEWAFENGAKEVCTGTTTMVDPERTAKLFERLGYTIVGSIFKKGA